MNGKDLVSRRWRDEARSPWSISSTMSPIVSSIVNTLSRDSAVEIRPSPTSTSTVVAEAVAVAMEEAV